MAQVIQFPTPQQLPSGLYSERAYFDGEPCQHVAAWEDHERLTRIERQCARAVRRR